MTRGRFLTPDSPGTVNTVCRTIEIYNAPDWLSLVTGALLVLCRADNYEEYGTATPDECAEFFTQALSNYLASTGACMLGAIFPYATTDAPAGTLACDGTQYLRVDYPLLYAALNTAFIDDADHFHVPDLRGQMVIGASGTYAVGGTGGAATHTLTAAEMPAHSHTTQPHVHTVIGVPTLDLLGELPGAGMAPTASSTGAAGVTVDSAGGGGAHNNMPPYTALSYCIVAE